MDIIRLIISILIPPVGVLISLLFGSETKMQRVASIISKVLLTLGVIAIIGGCILVSASNGYEQNLENCRKAYKCDPSDGDYQTCYYCKDKNCSKKGTVQCVNDTDEKFNYATEAGDDEE